MQKYNIYEAKTYFSKVINLVEHNEEVLISRNGKTVAKIIPFAEDIKITRKFRFLVVFFLWKIMTHDNCFYHFRSIKNK